MDSIIRGSSQISETVTQVLPLIPVEKLISNTSNLHHAEIRLCIGVTCSDSNNILYFIWHPKREMYLI